MHRCSKFRSGYWKCLQVLFNHGNHIAVSTLDLVHEHFPQNEEKRKKEITETWKKTIRLKNEMKCSHSSTSVPNVARLVGLRSWKGSSQKSLTSQWMLVQGLNTHRAFTVGIRLECMRKENPKGVGVRGKRPIRGRKKGRRPSRKIIIDFILIDTDYPPIGYAIQRRGRWEMKREWKKSVKKQRNTSGNIYSKHTIKYAKYMQSEIKTPCIISNQIIIFS